MTCVAFCPLVALPRSRHRVLTPAHSFATKVRRRRVLNLLLSPQSATSVHTTPLRVSRTHVPRENTTETPLRTDTLPTPSCVWPSLRPLTCAPPPPSSPPPNPHGDNRSHDFPANVGSVIESLCNDYPRMLTDEPDLEFFRGDVILSDTTGYRLSGKDAYRTVLFLLRAHTRLFLTGASLHVVSLFYCDDVRPAVHVRWRMRATPRVWARASREGAVIVDGLCVYYLDCDGLVAHHTFETRVRGGTEVKRPAFQGVGATGYVAVETGCAAGVLERDFSTRFGLPFWSPSSYPLLEALASPSGRRREGELSETLDIDAEEAGISGFPTFNL